MKVSKMIFIFRFFVSVRGCGQTLGYKGGHYSEYLLIFQTIKFRLFHIASILYFGGMTIIYDYTLLTDVTSQKSNMEL